MNFLGPQEARNFTGGRVPHGPLLEPPLPLGEGACLTNRNTHVPGICYQAKFGHSRSNLTGVSRGSKKFWGWWAPPTNM